jgi:hypothetical protein
MGNPYVSRKFIIVGAFTTATIAALFINKLSGAEFVTMAGLLVGSFTAGDVALNWIHRDKPEKPDALGPP